MRAYSGGRDSLGSQGEDLQLLRPRNLANLNLAAMSSGVSICACHAMLRVNLHAASGNRERMGESGGSRTRFKNESEPPPEGGGFKNAIEERE